MFRAARRSPAGGLLFWEIVPSLIRILHARVQPLARGRDMDQNAVAEPRVGQPIGLIHPAPNGARITVNFSGERLKVEIIVEKTGIGHSGTVSAIGGRCRHKLRTAGAASSIF